MKLICSAGHIYDTENLMHTWWRGVRELGDKCPESMSYDIMATPKEKKCNRKLKEYKQQ